MLKKYMLMIFLRINGRILKAMSLSKERSEHDKKETFVFIVTNCNYWGA